LKRIKTSFKPSFPEWRGQKVSGKVLTIILISAIAGAIGALDYFTTAPNVGEKSTEFYVLGLVGKAQDYPTELIVGQEGSVIVGIVNREHEQITYEIEVMIDGAQNGQLGPATLGPDEKWEKVACFVPRRIGGN